MDIFFGVLGFILTLHPNFKGSNIEHPVMKQCVDFRPPAGNENSVVMDGITGNNGRFFAKVALYKVGEPDVAKMFALIKEGSDPAVVSLKCDPLLAEKLREQYESVQPGYHLNKKYWNTIVCSGQLPEQDIHDLIDLSYRLVVEGLPKNEQTKLVK